MNCRDAQRGFTVSETLISLLVIVGVGFVTLAMVQVFSKAISARSSAQGGTVALEQQIESLRSDAATSYAVFVPEQDVHKHYNAPAPAAGVIPNGHEVDFYSRTDAGLETWWAYTYDAVALTLQRYDYDADGNIGVADRDTGAIDTSAQYPKLTGVRAFTAQILEADQLTNQQNVFAPLVSRLVAGAVPQALPVGFVPKSGTPRADLYGGNVTVQLTLVTDRGTRTLHLESAALPSGFTIHQTPSIRAVTYRIDTYHRSWFGLAQITHVEIWNQLLFSYDPKALPDEYKVWCDYEVFGSGTTGLRVGDPNTDYHKNYFVESAPGIFYAVTNVGADGKNGTSGLRESPGCHEPVPKANATPLPPVPVSSDPDVIDSPPPCFLQGICWPPDAPANWTPPSPWPTAPPPAAWCATHQESPLCGGIGGTPPPPTADSPAPQAYETPDPMQSVAPTPNSNGTLAPPPVKDQAPFHGLLTK